MNLWKLVVGIDVQGISQYNNESEMLLVDQYIPIAQTDNFESDLANNVDHLMYSLKEYAQRIDKASLFYRILGFAYDEKMIDLIHAHRTLYDRVSVNGMEEQIVLERLVNELHIESDELCQKNEALTNKVSLLN